jgi:hypothetical protein
MQHTTLISEAPCLHCRTPLLYAWDEGLLVRADAREIDLPTANTLRFRGRHVYVRTHGGNLIHETLQRVGTLRLLRSRHVEHDCPRKPDLGHVRPRAQQGGLW